MSVPWPDYQYFLPYPPGELWAYNYQQLPPSFNDGPVGSAMASGGITNGSPQSLPAPDNFVPTMDLEANHDAQSVGGSDSW